MPPSEPQSVGLLDPPAGSSPAETTTSRELKPQLRVTDLVLLQILSVIGATQVGPAAKLGSSALVFWIFGAVLFYLPSALVIIYLSGRIPFEGGSYQWAKLGFGKLAGFLTAWNVWLFNIAYNAYVGVVLTSQIPYIFGNKAQWMAESKPCIAIAGFSAIAALSVTTIRGLAIGKWLHNVSTLLLMACYGLLIALPFIVSLQHGPIASYQPFHTTLPPLTLATMLLFSKSGFQSFAGLDQASILAEECCQPRAAIRRSILVAAPLILFLLILGTSSINAFVRPADVDLVNPLAQSVDGAARLLGLRFPLAALVGATLLLFYVAATSVGFTELSRLPMVAGWDGLVPRWFTRLHPVYRTPVNSVAFIVAVSSVLMLAGLLDGGRQEMFQLLFSVTGVFYALSYVAIFLAPLAGAAPYRNGCGVWLKIAATSGLAMTLAYIGLSLFPIVDVQSIPLFAAKLVGITIACNLGGMALYRRARRDLDRRLRNGE